MFSYCSIPIANNRYDYVPLFTIAGVEATFKNFLVTLVRAFLAFARGRGIEVSLQKTVHRARSDGFNIYSWGVARRYAGNKGTLAGITRPETLGLGKG